MFAHEMIRVMNRSLYVHIGKPVLAHVLKALKFILCKDLKFREITLYILHKYAYMLVCACSCFVINIISSSLQAGLVFCSYPFVLNSEAKANLLQVDANYQMMVCMY